MTSVRARSSLRALPVLAMWSPWLLTRCAGVLLLLHKLSWYPVVSQDIELYHRYGHAWTVLHLLPYRDLHVEYPPGILPLLRLPDTAYVASFLLLALTADAIAQRMLWHQATPWGGRLWLVAPIAIGPLFWARLDVFVAALLVVGVLTARQGRWLLAGACLGYATMLKLWPLVLVIAVIAAAPRSQRGRAFVGAGGVVVLLTLPVLLYGGAHGLMWMLRYQSGHGIEIESVAAAPIQLLVLLGHWTSVVHEHGTAAYADTSLVRDLSRLFDVLFAGALLAAVYWATRWLRRGADTAPILLMLVAVIFATSKILSAQYAMWALAAVAVCVDGLPESRRRAALVGWTLAALATTQMIYPFAFGGIPRGDAVPLLEALLHAAVVLGFSARAIGEARALSGPRLTGERRDQPFGHSSRQALFAGVGRPSQFHPWPHDGS